MREAVYEIADLLDGITGVTGTLGVSQIKVKRVVVPNFLAQSVFQVC